MYEFFFSFLDKFLTKENMQLCGCLPVGNAGVRDEEQQSVKKYSLKRGRSIENRLVFGIVCYFL